MSMIEGEVIRVEWGSKEKPKFTDMKFERGQWWKLDKRSGSWRQAVSTDIRRKNDFLVSAGRIVPADQADREQARSKILEHIDSAIDKLRESFGAVFNRIEAANTLPDWAQGRFQTPQEALADMGGAIPNKEEDLLASLDVNNETILRPDYLHKDAEAILGAKLPSYRVFGRPEIGGDRHYLYAIPNPDRTSARSWMIQRPLPGVTSILKKTMPTPPELVKWMASFPGGYEAAREYTDLAARKGTIMHSVFADHVNGLVPDLESTDWHEYMTRKMKGQKADMKHYGEWQHFMKKALLSFMQWMEDFEVTIICMEVSLVSESLGYAGQVDVICQMNKSKYTEKTPADKRVRVNAIVDFKSGKYNSDSHSVQLSMYIPLIQEAFPGFKVDMAWNWHPKDWREKPNKDGEWNFSYDDINQTSNLSLDEASHLIALYNMKHRREPDEVVKFTGKPVLGGKPSELVKTVAFEEHWESTLHLAMDLGLEM